MLLEVDIGCAYDLDIYFLFVCDIGSCGPSKHLDRIVSYIAHPVDDQVSVILFHSKFPLSSASP